MTYTLYTKIPADRTKRDLYEMFERWADAELLAITNSKDYYQTASVSFLFRDTPVRVEYSQQGEYKSNLRAIYLTLEGLRLSFSRGLGDILTGTVSQMLKLGQGAVTRDPYEVLGVRPDAPIEDISDMYKIKAKRLHPDVGGSPEEMIELNAAYERIRADREEAR